MELYEDTILTPEEEDKYLKLSGARKINFIYKIINSKDRIPNQNSIKNYISVIYDSINEDGFDTDTNPFLDFVRSQSNTVNLNSQQAALIRNLLKSGALDLSKTAQTQWLYDKNAYNGSDYKIKALAFITGPKAEAYGNTEQVPSVVTMILKAKDDDKIKSILGNWQTKNGEDTTVKKVSTRATAKTNFPTDKPDVAAMKDKLLTDIQNTVSNTKADLIKAIQANYKDGMNEQQLLLALMKSLGQNATRN